jgi:D-3-phosphoglycerate dehydrogenase / 2-oxoglutarate reductase
VEVEFQPNLGKDKDRLAGIIHNFDGLAIRSATKVTSKILERATNLKVIGRAGIGVDNVDIPAATAKGIIVMNTPFGNSITTAEHAIALMFALARQIPAADLSTQAGKWEKNRFMGIEITGKVLGLIGCGNIGSIVAERAIGLRMQVIAYDPFLSPERAIDLGVEKVELDDLLARADFITLHTPMTAQTKNILSAENLAKTKKGVHIINCARGGLVDEKALRSQLDAGHIAGAALDVFVTEPATENPLFGHPSVVCTPHLGASTNEAQENVALQVAEQMSDYLTRGAITNAVNFPSITAEEAPKLKPFIALAERLGSFAGQLATTDIKKVSIIYEGTVVNLKTKALTAAAIAGLLRPALSDVNVVSAPSVAKERGIVIDEITRAAEGDYESLITLMVETEREKRVIAGTVFHDGKPRIVSINDIKTDSEFAATMIYASNEDRPGFVGRFASLLGTANINIATLALGRDREGGSAISLIAVDGIIPEKVLTEIRMLPEVKQANVLKF